MRLVSRQISKLTCAYSPCDESLDDACIPCLVQCLAFGKHCHWWLYPLGKIASCSFVDK